VSPKKKREASPEAKSKKKRAQSKDKKATVTKKK